MKKNALRVLLLTLFIFGISSFIFAKKDDSQSKKHGHNKNMIVREYNTDVKGNTKSMDRQITYDANGLKVEEIEYGKHEQMRQRITFAYDVEGNCIKEVMFDERNKPCKIRKIVYNADGLKQTLLNYSPDGRLLSTKKFLYSVKK